MPSAAAITTFSKIKTEAGKKQTILDAVTLTSCDGDTTEQQLKIERLMSIIDDEVLDFVLNEYALPFRDYKEGSRQIGRDTILDTNQFLHIVGSTSDFLYFCCYYFYIPTEAEIMNEIPPDMIANKGRFLANRKFNAEGEHR